MGRGQSWTGEEEKLLQIYYPTHGSKWDGWKLVLPNRTSTSIRNMASDMGLYKEDGKRLSEGQRRFILKGVIKIAEALGVPREAVAAEVIRMKADFERERL